MDVPAVADAARATQAGDAALELQIESDVLHQMALSGAVDFDDPEVVEPVDSVRRPWLLREIDRVARVEADGHSHDLVQGVGTRMNEPGLALRYPEQTANDGFPCYPLFEKDGNLDSLRGDPRFTDFMARQKRQWEYFKAAL